MRTGGIALLALVLLVGCTRYELETPDAEVNRRGYARHLGAPPPASVREVYYYADEMGADTRYQLAFKAGPEVIREAVRRLDLVPVPETWAGLPPREDLPFWGEGATRGLAHWVFREGSLLVKELWYDEDAKQAYFFEYTL
jgi:hypothetical protein